MRVRSLLIILVLSSPSRAAVGLKAGVIWANLGGDSIDEVYTDTAFKRSAAQSRPGWCLA
jgi:hypothetical protein